MGETLATLELRRKKLYQQLERLGDFRRGTVLVNYRKCGKDNCACARADHPGHGPQYLWNATIKGKGHTQNLRWGPELKKVEQEVENYRCFARLCEELVEVNEKICRIRPVKAVKEKQELNGIKKNCRGDRPRSDTRIRPYYRARTAG